MKIRLLEQAAEEARSALRWYRRRNPEAATRFRDELRSLWGRLRSTPAMYPVYDEEIRRALVPGFPYQVFFRVLEDEIEVLAVAHTHRRPDYWRSRL